MGADEVHRLGAARLVGHRGLAAEGTREPLATLSGWKGQLLPPLIYQRLDLSVGGQLDTLKDRKKPGYLY